MPEHNIVDIKRAYIASAINAQSFFSGYNEIKPDELKFIGTDLNDIIPVWRKDSNGKWVAEYKNGRRFIYEHPVAGKIKLGTLSIDLPLIELGGCGLRSDSFQNFKAGWNGKEKPKVKSNLYVERVCQTLYKEGKRMKLEYII